MAALVIWREDTECQPFRSQRKQLELCLPQLATYVVCMFARARGGVKDRVEHDEYLSSTHAEVASQSTNRRCDH
jgi:hypothetical protein